VRSAGRLFELSIRNVCHREPAQRSRAISLVDRRQRTKTPLVQRDRLLRLAGRQPAARALDLDVARRAVRSMPLVRIAYGVARRPGVRLVEQPLRGLLIAVERVPVGFLNSDRRPCRCRQLFSASSARAVRPIRRLGRRRCWWTTSLHSPDSPTDMRTTRHAAA
jgi:hypothetical protein